MSFVLIAKTKGDDLIRSATSIVAESSDRERLERLMTRRAAVRENWLALNPLPDWAQGGLIASEEIVEVASV